MNIEKLQGSRIVAINTPELQGSNIVRLETNECMTVDKLLQTAFRMKSDYIIIGGAT